MVVGGNFLHALELRCKSLHRLSNEKIFLYDCQDHGLLQHPTAACFQARLCMPGGRAIAAQSSRALSGGCRIRSTELVLSAVARLQHDAWHMYVQED